MKSNNSSSFFHSTIGTMAISTQPTCAVREFRELVRLLQGQFGLFLVGGREFVCLKSSLELRFT